MTSATASLSLVRSAPRRACLDITLPDGGFILATIEIGRQYGGAFASADFIRAALLKAAQSRADFEAKTHGFVAPVVAWEA